MFLIKNIQIRWVKKHVLKIRKKNIVFLVSKCKLKNKNYQIYQIKERKHSSTSFKNRT